MGQRTSGRLAAAGAAAALVLAASACTSSPGTGATPSPPPSAGASSATPSAQPSTRSDAQITWTSLRGPFALNERVHDVDGGRHLFETLDDGVVTLISRDATGAEVRLPLGTDDILQQAHLTPDGAVLEVTNDVERTATVMWWPTGKVRASVLWDNTADRDGGSIAVIGSTLYLDEMTADATCLLAMDLSAADPASTGQAVTCAQPGHVLAPSTDGTTLAWTDEARDEDAGKDADADACATLMRLTGGEAERVDIDGCVERGTASTTLAAWSEHPVAEVDGSLAYGRVPTKAAYAGTTIDLGHGVSGSAVVCHGRVLWEVEDGVETPEVHSWQPESTPEVIYRSPAVDADGAELAAGVYGITCLEDGSIGMHVVTGSGEQSMEFLVAALP